MVNNSTGYTVLIEIDGMKGIKVDNFKVVDNKLEAYQELLKMFLMEEKRMISITI